MCTSYVSYAACIGADLEGPCDHGMLDFTLGRYFLVQLRCDVISTRLFIFRAIGISISIYPAMG